MKKIILNINFFVLITLSILGLSIVSLYTSNTFSKYYVDQNRQTLIITFPNNQYVTIRPESDLLLSPDGTKDRPFGGIDNSVNLNSYGFDFLFFKTKYEQVLSTGDNTRTVSIERISNDTIHINYNIQSKYELLKGLIYQIQIDYSGDKGTVIRDEPGSIAFVDDKCQLTFKKNESYVSEVLHGYNSFTVKQPYTQKLNFNIDLQIKCSK